MKHNQNWCEPPKQLIKIHRTSPPILQKCLLYMVSVISKFHNLIKIAIPKSIHNFLNQATQLDSLLAMHEKSKISLTLLSRDQLHLPRCCLSVCIKCKQSPQQHNTPIRHTEIGYMNLQQKEASAKPNPYFFLQHPYGLCILPVFIGVWITSCSSCKHFSSPYLLPIY